MIQESSCDESSSPLPPPRCLVWRHRIGIRARPRHHAALRCVGVEDDGANAAQGGPITGLIPLAVGNAEASDGVVAVGRLGFDTSACPADLPRRLGALSQA